MPLQNDFNFPSTPMCSLISKLTVFQGFFHFECLFISFEFFTKNLLCFPSLSCKWVGLFVILWAGITTVLNLWDLLGDLSLSLVSIISCLLYQNINK